VESVPTLREADVASGQLPRTSDRRQRRRLVMAVIWTVVIMVLCWVPGDFVRKVEDGSSWFEIPDLDKIVHGAIFVIFTILWARVLSSRVKFAWVALGGFVLAVVTELAQLLPVVGRDGEIGDVLTDAAGILIGIVIAPLIEPLARIIERRLFPEPTDGPVPAESAAATGAGR
jgi:VanZ like family